MASKVIAIDRKTLIDEINTALKELDQSDLKLTVPLLTGTIEAVIDHLQLSIGLNIEQIVKRAAGFDTAYQLLSTTKNHIDQNLDSLREFTS
jgi:hypothetical protein